MDPLFILFNRMPFLHLFCYIRFKNLFPRFVTLLFTKRLSRPQVRSKIRIPLSTFHSILRACTKCDTCFSTLYVKSESLPLFTYSRRQEDNSLNKRIV